MKKRNFLGRTASCCSVIILAILFFASSSFALDKFGTITADEIWSGAISVTANVTVPVGVSVAIEPGAVISFADSTTLVVAGGLVVRGNSEHPVLFTSASAIPTPGKWVGVQFNVGALSSSSVSRAIFEYAANGISLNTTSPDISDTVFRHNTIGINLSYSSPTITKSSFDQNGQGIYVSAGSQPDINNSIFMNNSDGIYIHWASSSSYPTIAKIHNNIIIDNQYGIRFAYAGNHSYESALIEYNTIANNNTGIYLASYYNSPIKINSNIITHNDVGITRVNSVQYSLSYNDVWGNVTNYSGLAAGISNISVDPLYVDRDRQNFHLLAYSPCIDAADPYRLDLDGTRADMGAYGGLGGENGDPNNLLPGQPVNTSPADQSLMVLPSLLMTIAGFTDPDANDFQTGIQWQIRLATGAYADPVYDSGELGLAQTSITIPWGILATGQNYYWHARYRDNKNGWSDYSKETSFTTIIDAGLPETQITSGPADGATTGKNVTFTWSGNDNLSAPMQYSYRLDDEEWSAYSDATSHTITGLSHGGPHAFEVRARDYSGNVDASPAIRTFSVDTVVPVISQVTATPRNNSLIITWHTDEPSTSRVEYGTSPTYGYLSSSINSLTTDHTYALSGLASLTPYYVRVRSVDAYGNEAISGGQSFTTLNDNVRPETSFTQGPGNGALIKSSSVTFTWTGSDDMSSPANLTYATRQDGGGWSDFSSLASVTLAGLSEGSHTFSVKAMDQAGNEDATPAVQTFVVDTSAPTAPTQVQNNVTQTGAALSWTTSSSGDIAAYHIYWDAGTGTINYGTPYAIVPASQLSWIWSAVAEGTYLFGVGAVDSAGNVETNTSLVTTVTIKGFTIHLNPLADSFYRGNSIPLAGKLSFTDGQPIVNAMVVLDVSENNYHRTYTAYSNSSGEFSYLFQPRAEEAGSYVVTATVLQGGVTKTQTAAFDIYGLYLQPPNATVEMSMNSTKTINFALKNIGSLELTGLQYDLADVGASDLVGAYVDIASLPTTLAAGVSIGIPVIVTAQAGSIPADSESFTLTVTSDQGATEVGKLIAVLKEAVAVPFVTPNPLKVGLSLDTNTTKILSVANKGFAPMLDATVQLHDPAGFPWVTVVNGQLGAINPAESRDCQLYVAPTSGLAMGTYAIQLDLMYGNKTLPIYLTVEVTTDRVGQAAFQVHDDTGSVVTNADVSLISKESFVTVTPNGTKDYKNVLKGVTDQNGYVLFTDVPVADYEYIISAGRHTAIQGTVFVEPGSTPQAIGAILETNLVDIDFSVTETTIVDTYNVTLNVTYTTTLTKPTLYASPSKYDLSFFPEEGEVVGVLSIRNTSNAIPVKDM